MEYVTTQSAAKVLGATPQVICERFRFCHPGLCIPVAGVLRVERRALADVKNGRDPRVVLMDGLEEFLETTEETAPPEERRCFFLERLAELYPKFLDRHGCHRVHCRIPSSIVKQILDEWQKGKQ